MSRSPISQPARIAPLAVLPVFYRLSGKSVLVIGATQSAIWKAELLASTGAHVTVLAPTVSDALAELCGRDDIRIRHVARRCDFPVAIAVLFSHIGAACGQEPRERV